MALSRDSVGALTIALLVVLGMGLVAATLTTTYTAQYEAGAPGGGADGPNDGFDDVTDGDVQEDTDEEGYPPSERTRPMNLPEICIPILTQPGVILGIVAAFVLIMAVAYRQFELLGAAFSIYLVGLPVTMAYALATQCPSSSPGGSGPQLRDLTETLPGDGGAVASTPIPPAILMALFGVAGVGAVVMLLTASGDEEVAPPPRELGEEETNLSQFAAAAGEAADRIEAAQADVDNAVFRAWREMTQLLDVGDPRATTAGEFADAAVEAGLADEDVRELTRLFDEVRYGELDPEPREELALETLRTIEETYSGDAAVATSRAAGEDDPADGAAGDDEPDAA